MGRVDNATGRSFSVGVIVVLCIAAVVYVAATASRGLPWERSTDARIAFADVGTLRPGDAVKQNSVRIGRVSAVEYADGRAVATVAVDPGMTIYRNARAVLSDESSLAKRFIELDPGTQEAGELGDDVLPIKQTMAATDLENVLEVFDEKTRDRLGVGVRALGRGAAGRSEDLHTMLVNAPGLLDEARIVLDALNRPEARLPELLAEIEAVTGAVGGRHAELRRLVRNLAPTLEALAVDEGTPLDAAIRDMPQTLDDATTGLRAVNPVLGETRAAVRDLRPGAEALGRATPSVRAFLRDSVRPLNKVPEVSEDATPALSELSGVMVDARPLASPLSRALVSLERPLRVLAPYRRDIMVFFSRASSLVSMTTPTGDHMARLGVGIPGLQMVTGGLVPNLSNYRAPYPAPGTADDYRVPGVTIPTGGLR